MAYELIITEKPNAAKKIAEALTDNKLTLKKQGTVPYYQITRDSKEIVVGCAVGHLYTLAEKNKKGWTYPVFDVEWKPSAEVSKGAKFSKKYITALQKLSKDADSFTVACDYDIEGEVIGLNVIRFACKKKDARRMKFSTLTKPDLIKAYDNAMPHLDWGQANAGVTRHELDWYYGINLSRALSLSIKNSTGMFKILSSGRVQGPALKIIVDKEQEIRAFKSEPFWQIELDGKVNNACIIAWHEEDKFLEKEKAEKVIERTKGKNGVVQDVTKKQFKQEPPHPFDLTTLQTEAYRALKISPKDTLAVAQELYLAGLISYPRTSSQKLPKEIEYNKILTELAKQEYYKGFAQQLLAKKNLVPNEGKKTDPAHPAIYPTGIITHIADRRARLYDLIVRRFLSTFSDAAVRETMNIRIDVNKEIFVAKGTRTVEKGWHIFYGPHISFKEEELPHVEKGQEVIVEKIILHDRETQPPRRYSPASIIKELEKRGLGTKSTRAAIVDSLYQRGYVNDVSIQATELGIRTVEVLKKYCPELVDEALTRKFEIEMEQIRQKKKVNEDVLKEAKEVLIKLLTHFKKNEKQIGEELSKAYKETRDELSYIGPCPNCDSGTLQVRKGRFGPFIACDQYPDCKTTFPLPSGALVKGAKKVCQQCGFPMVKIIRRGKKPMDACINLECFTKLPQDKSKLDELLAVERGELKKSCPKCQEGLLVVRKSMYGKFLGCGKFPKCRYTESPNRKNAQKKEEVPEDQEIPINV